MPARWSSLMMSMCSPPGGGPPQGGLVQHEQLGVGHEGPPHGQHLLLAAGQGARHLTAALLQPGELLVHLSRPGAMVEAGWVKPPISRFSSTVIC